VASDRAVGDPAQRRAASFITGPIGTQSALIECRVVRATTVLVGPVTTQHRLVHSAGIDAATVSGTVAAHDTIEKARGTGPAALIGRPIVGQGAAEQSALEGGPAQVERGVTSHHAIGHRG